MPNHRPSGWGLLSAWLLLTASTLFRPLVPVDETRYLSVAWEMWQRGDFLVPYLNGETYSHKPPLLFWLIHLGWAVLGVNEEWARCVGALSAWVNLLLTRHLARKIWPHHIFVHLIAPWLLLATLLWTLFATAIMFDCLLTNFVLLGMLGLVLAAQGEWRRGWLYFALAIGLGALSKGPVVLIHLLPTALFACVWHARTGFSARRWYGFLGLAVIAGVAIALVWAIPAAVVGGENYGLEIFWHQTADRTIKTQIHSRPFAWFLLFLPLILFPWLAWGRVWQAFSWKVVLEDSGLKLCGIWFIATVLIFSIIRSKQLHYLLPALPAFSLFLAGTLNRYDPPQRLTTDVWLPLLLSLGGVFLMVLPQIPAFSNYAWVRASRWEWGLSVMLVGAGLLLFTCHQRRLSVIAASYAMVIAVFVSFIFFFQYNAAAFDLKPAALRVKALQDNGVPVAFVGHYQGQFNFLGRMTAPLTVVTRKQAKQWAKTFPEGQLITLEEHEAERADYQQHHRESWLIFRNSRMYLAAMRK